MKKMIFGFYGRKSKPVIWLMALVLMGTMTVQAESSQSDELVRTASEPWDEETLPQVPDVSLEEENEEGTELDEIWQTDLTTVPDDETDQTEETAAEEEGLAQLQDEENPDTEDGYWETMPVAAPEEYAEEEDPAPEAMEAQEPLEKEAQADSDPGIPAETKDFGDLASVTMDGDSGEVLPKVLMENPEGKKAVDDEEKEAGEKKEEESGEDKGKKEKEDSDQEETRKKEQEYLATTNQVSANGITVYGNTLPGMVSLLVGSGSGYYFSVAEGADIFQSYDFKLWDTLLDQEYFLPEGETVTIAIPVPAGFDYTVEHLLAGGGTEIISPQLVGGVLYFETSSFSSFGIAGSYPMATGTAEAPEENNAGAAQPTQQHAVNEPVATIPQQSTTASTPHTANSIAGSASFNTDTAVAEIQAGSATVTPQAPSSQANSKGAVQTGDDTPILPFVLMGLAAVILIALLIFLKKRRR
ncbi:MAG: LPXTG cell wall anchor domain-containing protein [Blautia sp.]|nr:LPXTG cell wall anchor domain-containing protein [Blautia sp.]